MSEQLGFLFPGQGAESAGMGLDLAAHSKRAADLMALAAEVSGVDLRRVLSAGGPELDRTEALQPALTAVSLAVAAELGDAGVVAHAVLGHSVGEVAAFAAAGAFSFEEAVRLAGVRGRLMAREAALHPGGMVALFATEAEVRAFLASEVELDLAVGNGPRHWLVSGPVDALQRASRVLESTPVRVSGAWHGRAMRGAVTEFEHAAQAGCSKANTALGAAPPRLYANRTGRRVEAGDDRAGLLVEQLVHPALFADGLRAMAVEGVDHVLALGCGRLLRGLVRSNLPAMRISVVEGPEDLRRFLAERAA